MRLMDINDGEKFLLNRRVYRKLKRSSSRGFSVQARSGVVYSIDTSAQVKPFVKWADLKDKK